MTTPNTPANGGQILTDERIADLYREAFKGMADRLCNAPQQVPPTVIAFGRAIEADLRAALAAPAIPTVDRNGVLEEAVRACKDERVTIDPTQSPVQPDDESYNLAISHCIGAISGLKSDDPASVPQPSKVLVEEAVAILSAPAVAQPATQVAVQKPDAWLIPYLLTFNGKYTSCPADLIPELEGTVAWGVELFSDGDGVTDKNGVQHKPRPLFAVPATDKTAEGL